MNLGVATPREYQNGDNTQNSTSPITSIPRRVRNSRNREKDKKDGKLKRIARATGTVMLGAGKNMAVGALRGFHPVRLAGKIAAGATVGTAGLLLGVASGDPSKALQYTTAGAMAGSALVNSLSGTAGNIINDETLENAQRAYYGEEYSEVYKQKIQEQQQRELESQENINMLMQMKSVDKEGAKEILEDTGRYCLNNTDIRDIRDIAAIDELINGEDGMAPEMAVAAYNYSQKRLGGQDISQMTADKVKRYKERWADEFKEKYPRLTYKQAEEYADQAFKAAIRFNKTRSDLTKF